MIVSDAGGLAHRLAIDDAWNRAWSASLAWHERAEAIDPWHPAIPKSMAVAAAAAGDPARARSAAEAALARNSGDGKSWANLALACEAVNDRACQEEALERAVATGSFGGAETVSAAFGADELGLAQAADLAFRRAILIQRLTTLDLEWPRYVPIGDAGLPEDFGSIVELNRLLGWWAMDEPIDPDSISGPSVRALAYAMLGDREAADEWLDRAVDAAPSAQLTWELAVALRDHWGRPTEYEQAVGAVVVGTPFPSRTDATPVARITRDIASFRSYPLDGLFPDAVRPRPDPAWPWALQQTLP
jgi:tetratricopeptide (TPR) repeat protein